MATKVLVVDDEHSIVDLVRGYLEREAFEVHAAYDGPAALSLTRDLDPDLVVLDVNLPGIDGIEVCRQLRRFSDAYVLMLTARAEEVDRIVGLTVGADDYLTKPFSPRELVARVRAMLRRPRTSAARDGQPEGLLRLGDLAIDPGRRAVTRDREQLDLTAREFDLLVMLAEHPGRVFTRAQILDRIWASEFYDDHVVEVHIGNLRRKLGSDPARYVETVRGVGYRAVEGAP
ncbi:MAG: response regulator transcription factor [Chloroflexi bacterium]|nr:response regulator transcription factor [Chloroflexota bacterium]